MLQGRVDAAHRLLVGEAERVRDHAPERAAAMLAEACLDCLLSIDVARAQAVADQACEVGENAAQEFRPSLP